MSACVPEIGLTLSWTAARRSCARPSPLWWNRPRTRSRNDRPQPACGDSSPRYLNPGGHHTLPEGKVLREITLGVLIALLGVAMAGGVQAQQAAPAGQLHITAMDPNGQP